MSKIICDVCGTSYPDTSTQCPICGCVRSAEAKVVAGDTNDEATKTNGSYTYVKGGRFSKANVRKRNNGKSIAAPAVTDNAAETTERKKSDKGLVIAVLALLLAIIAVVVYISVRFFAPMVSGGVDKIAGDTTANTLTQDTTEATKLDIPCTGITVSKTTAEFDAVGDVLLLDVVVNPEDTTDPVTFASDNEAVATVDTDGKVVAVGPGEAIITVSCGEATAQCKVVCNIEVESTEPDATEETAPVGDFALNREDFTLAAKGESWVLYSGEISKEHITWSSEDEKVATVEDGKVVAVGPGYTNINAEYNGKKYTCIVRCTFEAVSGETAEPEETVPATNGTYTISSTDVTINVGESFALVLADSNGNTVNVSWATSGDACSVSGNTVTGVSASSTGVKVYTTYGGAEYSCIVRVKAN